MFARLLAPEALFGLGLAGLGVFVLVAAEAIVSPTPWGPGLMPRIVGLGLVLLGVATLIERARVPVSGQGQNKNDWPGVAFVLAGVVAFGVLVVPAGFPLAAAAMFALVARGHGSRAPVRDVLVGLALAASAYLVFAHGLGLPLTWGGVAQTALGGRP